MRVEVARIIEPDAAFEFSVRCRSGVVRMPVTGDVVELDFDATDIPIASWRRVKERFRVTTQTVLMLASENSGRLGGSKASQQFAASVMNSSPNYPGPGHSLRHDVAEGLEPGTLYVPFCDPFRPTLVESCYSLGHGVFIGRQALQAAESAHEDNGS